MRVSFQISDELYEHYVSKFGVPRCFQTMRQHLETMSDADPNDRYLLIAGDNRRALEAIFQTTIDDCAKLIKMTKNLCQVKVAGIDIDFTADELARIDAQAGFHGRTREEFINQMLVEIKDTFLDKV